MTNAVPYRTLNFSGHQKKIDRIPPHLIILEDLCIYIGYTQVACADNMSATREMSESMMTEQAIILHKAPMEVHCFVEESRLSCGR